MELKHYQKEKNGYILVSSAMQNKKEMLIEFLFLTLMANSETEIDEIIAETTALLHSKSADV